VPDYQVPIPQFAAVVTTYKPDERLLERLQPMLRCCEHVVLVDNTPGGHRFAWKTDRMAVSILQDGQNKGLGRALNLGIAAARRAGARTVVLFDQDSTPDDTFLRRMHALVGTQRRLCIGPLHVDDAVGPASADAPARAALPAQPALRPLTCLPTSGMTFCIDELGPADDFAEEFFLDLVDFDWCWRLRQRGWQFFRALDVVMLHRLGLGQRKFLHLTYHVPAPYRHYFQFRDTLRLTTRPYVPLYSKLRLAGILPLKVLAYPFLMDRGWERLRWMARGLVDAFRRVGGIGAAAETLNR